MKDLELDNPGDLVAKPAIDASSFTELKADRLDRIDLFFENQPQHYRYRLTVVDRPILPTHKLAHVTAVILVPAGREGEYVFSSHRGLLQLAESADCARVVAVAFGRHHAFESQAAVQQELTFVVQVISQQGRFLTPALLKRHLNNLSIPFMALDGIGARDVLAEGETAMSGRYLIEQVKATERIVRRLYFMNNPFVIQSEVAMDGDKVDRSYLAFDYHKHMAAGILALPSINEHPTGMVIGLGGSGLVNFLLHVLKNLHLTVVELDSSVVTIAEKFFGFETNNMVTTFIGDGLKVTGDLEKESGITVQMESFDFIAIDVDSKDTSVGMSCPPLAFVDVPYLAMLKGLLRENGILVINVSARDPAMFSLVKNHLEQVFDSIFVSADDLDDEKQDLNLVVFAALGANSSNLIPVMQRIEKLQKRLQPLIVSKVDNVDWKETISDLEDCLAGLRILSDDTDAEEKTMSMKKDGKGKGSSGKKKRGKRK